MTQASAPQPQPPQRPALALRVGITGTRKLRPDQEARLRHKVTTLLRAIRREVGKHAASLTARAAYQGDDGTRVPFTLRFISPLAEGADRLGAQVALDEGYALHVPMPFWREAYVRDFAPADPDPGWDCGADPLKPSDAAARASGAAFESLLARAEATLELDGGRDDPAAGRYDEARSYEAVGRFVARNSDLLIAIWDGKPPSGRGGTFDIVRFAMEVGTPVWWIHADKPEKPVWLNDTVEPRATPGADSANSELLRYLGHLILPPPLHTPHHRHSFIEWATRGICPTPRPPHLVYAEERALPPSRLWHAHAGLLDVVAWWRAPKPVAKPCLTDPVALAWNASYKSPDALAYELGRRFRSAYVMVFALVSLSLVCAAVSLVRHAGSWVQWPMAVIEAVSLLLILALLVANISQDWHQRWIDYRLLAELCRKQQALAPLGWSLPGRAIATLQEEADQRGGEPDHAAWVAWFFGALIRAAPLPQGRFEAATLAGPRQRVLDDLVVDQLRYHSNRQGLYDTAGRRLVRAGEALFIGVALLVGWKLCRLGRSVGPPELLELMTVVLPTLGAAFVGIRAYAELQLLAGHSRHMCGVMRRAKQRLENVDLSRKLASQELGAITHGVAITMLQEVDGWARMFRVKVVEAG